MEKQSSAILFQDLSIPIQIIPASIPQKIAFEDRDALTGVELTVQYFCKPKEISDLLLDRCCYLLPEAGSEQSYCLFRRGMLSNRAAAVCRLDCGQDQRYLALFPNQDCILAFTLFRKDEIQELPIIIKRRLPKETMSAMKQQIAALIQEFDWQ